MYENKKKPISLFDIDEVCMMSEANNQEKVYLSRYIISDPHSEYLTLQDFTVDFINQEKNIKKQIIDKDGNILNFPGVEYTEKLKEELGKSVIEPIVKYEALFERVDDGRFIMVWTVRPDGRYWMDSWGFGAEDYESLSLYTYIDADGNFTMPFKLHSIGYSFYGDYQLRGDKAYEGSVS
ncbi:MAG: hypothetical protein IJY33_02865 [Oscillospiraceae bacterium]|nr:hypothetical protein [Oscillospiraceae bacterium]